MILQGAIRPLQREYPLDLAVGFHALPQQAQVPKAAEAALAVSGPQEHRQLRLESWLEGAAFWMEITLSFRPQSGLLNLVWGIGLNIDMVLAIMNRTLSKTR